MTVTAVTLPRPTFYTHLSRPHRVNPLNHDLGFPVSASKTVFFGGFYPGRAGSKTMIELVNRSVFSKDNGNGEERVRLSEQNAVVGGSSRFTAEGLEATINRLSKWVVSALLGAVILWRHDADALWCATGSVVNAILSWTLKRTLNQERPIATLTDDPGMPSSHAQSIFFTSMFAILSVVEMLGINEITLTLSALVLALGSYLSWLRVSQRFHTVSQVVVGATVGSVFSISWYWSWNAFVLDAFASSPWVRVIVNLGAMAFCVGFILYVIRCWLTVEG